MIYIVLLFILVLCWTTNPFFKKIVMNKLNPYEFFLINNILVMVFLFIYLMGLQYVNKQKNIEIKKMVELNSKELSSLLFGAIISLASGFMFLHLIKMDNITKLISISQSLTIICSLIIGYMFFSESINPKDIFGILLIVFGVTVIKYKNK